MLNQSKEVVRICTPFQALREKCPYSELFSSVFSPNVGKYEPE